MSTEHHENIDTLTIHADRISDSLLTALDKLTPALALLSNDKDFVKNSTRIQTTALIMALLKLSDKKGTEIVQLASAGKQWVAMGMCDLESDSMSSKRTIEVLNEIRAGRANSRECSQCDSKTTSTSVNESTAAEILAEIEAEQAL